MIKKFAGYALLAIALFCFTYFKNYRGNIIPFPTIWYYASFVLMLAAGYLIITARTKKQVQQQTEEEAHKARLKYYGEKILIELEHCQFKTTTLNESLKEEQNRTKALNTIWEPGANDSESNTTVIYIIYKHQNGNTVEKFVSHAFLVDETMLKYYISNSNVVLYVDRHQRSQYLFGLKPSD